MELLERAQQEATKMMMGWKHLRELGLLSPEKTLRDFINIYEYHMQKYKGGGATVFPETKEATGTN